MSEVIRRETDKFGLNEAAETLLSLQKCRDRFGLNEAAETLLSLQIYRDFRVMRRENAPPANVPCNRKTRSRDTTNWKPANTRQQDLIMIGESGRTWMKKKDYMKIKFNNYKKATRTILMGVFGSRTLATHTRSGKPCPIYKNTANRKVKPQLPEVPLEDIRTEIRKHFKGLADELINESITTKCADEGRKYRKKEETAPED